MRISISSLRAEGRSPSSRGARDPQPTTTPKTPPSRHVSLNGHARAGVDEKHRIAKLGGTTIPRFPDSSIIAPAEAPPPAFIRPDFTPLDRAQELAATYRAACVLEFHNSSVYMLRGNPESHKDFSFLVDFANLLEIHHVQPAVWALFSFRAWKALGREKPPTVRWCYSAKRLDSQQAYFEDQRADLVCDYLPPVAQHVQLVADHHEMWRDLLGKHPTSIDEVRAIVDQHFPKDTYERRVEEVQAITRAAQARAMTRARNGEILWST